VLFETLRDADFLTTGKPPLLGVFGLAVALVSCVIIVWARLRIGQAMHAWARAWVAGFPVADSIPRRYVIDDRGSRLASALCAVIDVVVLLLMQSTVREPLLLLTSSYTRQASVESAFTLLILVMALVILSGVYRTSKPVLAYLAWSVMDRLVPTAGFLAGGMVPVLPRATTASRPALAASSNGPTTPVSAAPRQVEHSVSSQDATVVAEQQREAPALADEPTVRAPSASIDQEATVVAEKPSDPDKTFVSQPHPHAKGDHDER
jgi:hypothetical protein